MSMPAIDPLALTRVEGGPSLRVRVPAAGEVFIGRDESCAIALDEDPVSRQHAKVLYVERRPELLDLGSMNGTFLNGKRIQRAFLEHGDRIQVGSSVFVVTVGEEDADPAAGPSARDGLASQLRSSRHAGPTSKQASAISGNLSEVKLVSLLQIIESDQSTGTLVILAGGLDGKIYVHQGLIRHATFGRTRGPKAFYRMTALQEGKFDFFIPGRTPEDETVEGSLQSHLLEAMRQQDEFALWRKNLPPAGARLLLNPQKHIVPAKVPPTVFDVLAAAVRYETVGGVIESCELPDSDICRVLLALLKHEVLMVEHRPRGKRTLPG